MNFLTIMISNFNSLKIRQAFQKHTMEKRMMLFKLLHYSFDQARMTVKLYSEHKIKIISSLNSKHVFSGYFQLTQADCQRVINLINLEGPSVSSDARTSNPLKKSVRDKNQSCALPHFLEEGGRSIFLSAQGHSVRSCSLYRTSS